MNNCSDWELFGNNLSCKKKEQEKKQHLLEKKSTYTELRGSLLMKRKVIV